MKKLRRTAAVLALLCGLTGCSAGETNTVTVFAASSLSDVMEPLTRQYATSHPAVKFSINFGSSVQLVQQIQSGADADVLITADEQAIAALTGSGLLGSEPAIIASNSIALALAPGNPAGISSLADLESAEARIARCAPAVPCGRATDRVLQDADLTLERTSTEDDVRSVLTKVSAGQADAGFVYTTDLRAAQSQGVTGISLSDPAPNRYPAVLVADGAGDAAAQAFHSWLTGNEAAQILRTAGFGPPAGGK